MSLPRLPALGTFGANDALTQGQAKQAFEDLLTEVRRIAIHRVGLPQPGTFCPGFALTIGGYNFAIEEMRTAARRAGALVSDEPFVGRTATCWIFGVDLRRTRKERDQLEELLVALVELRTREAA